MLRLLFRQPLHIWRTFEIRYKLEAIALFILIFAFLGTRLDNLFGQWVGDIFSKTELTLLVANLFTFQISITGLFIISWLIPRQNSLRPFLTRPLCKNQLIKLVGFHSFKYLSLYLILFLPTATALYSAIGLISFLSALMIVLIFSLFYLIHFIQQKQKYSLKKFIFRGLLSILFYHGLFGLFFYVGDYLLLFQIVSTFLVLAYTIKMYSGKDMLPLENFIPYLEKVYSKPEIDQSARKRMPQFLPAIVQPLFEKEVASLWRNPNYKRLKIKSIALFFILNTLIIISNIEYKETWISILTALLIWVHYSNGFNDKYVFADPSWFIKTLPMRFRHLFAAKFIAEIGYVILLTFGVLIFYQFCDITFSEQLTWLAALFLFANVVLFTMLNFQIMFFNDPRLAGYAYHFAMFFIIIMALNFQLVGPIIGLCLLMFFLYKNVRYFNE